MQKNEIKKQIQLIFFLLLIFMGPGCCNQKIYILPQKYRPLKRIKERPKLPFIENTTVCVIGRTVYVNNLNRWLRENPPNSDAFNDCLAHERVHSRRQLRYGLLKWLLRYSTDKKFRLYEEQLGYYISIKRKIDRGSMISLNGYANSMSSNYFGMINYDDAVKWIDDVVSGKWKPLEGDEED